MLQKNETYSKEEEKTAEICETRNGFFAEKTKTIKNMLSMLWIN